MLLIVSSFWLALFGQAALGADPADFRIRWLLHQESGGIEQLEQWNVACSQAKCTIGRWFSGRDFGQKSVPVARAKELLAEAERLPAASESHAPAAAHSLHHEERVWVDQSEKSWTKARSELPETDDISSGLAWAQFELDLRHAWEGQD
jgi:hypothetical protein